MSLHEEAPETRPSELLERQVSDLLKSLHHRLSNMPDTECEREATQLVASEHHFRREADVNRSRRTPKELKACFDRIIGYAERISGTFTSIQSDIDALAPPDMGSNVSSVLNRQVDALLECFTRLATANEERTRIDPDANYVRSVTRVAAEAFTHLTGRKATVSTRHMDTFSVTGQKAVDCGPFLEFLTQLYYIFNIKDSPAHRARELRKFQNTKTK
jgi:hypothetical protein